jgi:hypothetical protein
MVMQSNGSLLPFQRWLSRYILVFAFKRMLVPPYSLVLLARYIETAGP